MGKRITNKIKRRFNGGIYMTFPKKPLVGSARSIHNAEIVKAFRALIVSLIGREPTEAEFLGFKDLSKEIEEKANQK